MPTSHITVRVGEQQADGSWLITDARWPASRYRDVFGDDVGQTYSAAWWSARLHTGPTFQTERGSFRIPTSGV